MIVERKENEAVNTLMWRDLLNKRDAVCQLFISNEYSLDGQQRLFLGYAFGEPDYIRLYIDNKRETYDDNIRDLLNLFTQNHIQVSAINADDCGVVADIIVDEEQSPFFRTEAQQQEAKQEVRTRESFNKDMIPFADSLAHFIMSSCARFSRL